MTALLNDIYHDVLEALCWLADRAPRFMRRWIRLILHRTGRFCWECLVRWEWAEPGRRRDLFYEINPWAGDARQYCGDNYSHGCGAPFCALKKKRGERQ